MPDTLTKQCWHTLYPAGDRHKIDNRRPAVNLDEYVGSRAVDALFVEIANQEKKIRENLAKRTTALLKKVFTYYSDTLQPS